VSDRRASSHPERSEGSLALPVRHPERSEGSLARCARFLPLLALVGCSWFTDFKQQPKIDPWETASDTIPFRGNPQMSVPITGSAAPGFEYDRLGAPQVFTTMANIPNPTPADSASVNRGRVQFQINCAVCHGPTGMGNGPVTKYGLYPASIGTAQSPAAGYTDGYIFAIIRNGKGMMPTYNRIEEPDRWDIINYVRSLQGKLAIAADTSHCRAGETGLCVPAASRMGPTRPSPYYHPGPMNAAAPVDTTKKPEQRP
jgi:mono/diheme cytochrome c family protein